jgi:hypothetical protein
MTSATPVRLATKDARLDEKPVPVPVETTGNFPALCIYCDAPLDTHAEWPYCSRVCAIHAERS